MGCDFERVDVLALYWFSTVRKGAQQFFEDAGYGGKLDVDYLRDYGFPCVRIFYEQVVAFFGVFVWEAEDLEDVAFFFIEFYAYPSLPNGPNNRRCMSGRLMICMPCFRVMKCWMARTSLAVNVHRICDRRSVSG